MLSQPHVAAQLRRLFERARALPPEEQAHFLDEACGSDSALREQVAHLLHLDARSDALLVRSGLSRRAGASRSRWERLEVLFEGALERSESERSAFLDAFCGDDPALRAELEALLGADEDASEYFEHLARVVLPAPPPHREAAAVLDDLV
ncbi:MAG: hypothetical protein GVY18_06615, partial [Bacteroidetes bacterium]|nr:hypothetical protein [Bacteroidota bacterium]